MVVAAIIQPGGADAFVVGHLPRHLELPAVTQIFSDTSRAEGVATDLGLDVRVSAQSGSEDPRGLKSALR